MSQNIPIYIPTYINNEQYAPVRVLPRLLFYNGMLECETYYIQSGSLTQSGISYAQNSFPYFDNYNVVTGSFPTTGSLSLLFNNEGAAYGTSPNESLYTQYWEKYISLLYNPYTRLFNCEGIIPLADYFNMELNDIVEWRGNYYHLRAINDYNLKNGECKIQLLGPILEDVITNLLPEKDCGFNFSSSVVDTQLFTFQISSSLDKPFTINNFLLPNLSGSGTNIGTTQTLPANSNISFSATASVSGSVPFLFYTTIQSASVNIREAIGANNYFDVRITDTYDNGLPALSASYLGNGGAVKGEGSWTYPGFWSASLWNAVDRKVEIGLSVNRDLVLYNMSGSNGFSSYNLAKPYLYSSGSIAKTIGITPVSQSIMQKGWGTVPAFNTDYTTRYQDNISARRFYIGDFDGNREIIRYQPDTYNTLSNISVQRLDKVTTQPILRKSNNNIGGVFIPQDPCAGSGSSSGDLYYNQESSSFYVRNQAAAFFNLTYANFNYFGAEVWLNSSLTHPFNGFGAFVDKTSLEFMQGNYTPSSDGIPFGVYLTGCFIFCPSQNVLETQYNCP